MLIQIPLPLKILDHIIDLKLDLDLAFQSNKHQVKIDLVLMFEGKTGSSIKVI